MARGNDKLIIHLTINLYKLPISPISPWRWYSDIMGANMPINASKTVRNNPAVLAAGWYKPTVVVSVK